MAILARPGGVNDGAASAVVGVDARGGIGRDEAQGHLARHVYKHI
jgi:hypothetical protein